MVAEALKVLATFILFAQIVQHFKAHNMITLMFDPRFKGLICVCKFVG
jgi:F0F1-type ATP synthase assembly protein I